MHVARTSRTSRPKWRTYKSDSQKFRFGKNASNPTEISYGCRASFFPFSKIMPTLGIRSSRRFLQFLASATLDPAVRGRGRRRLRCACWWHTSIMGGYYVSMNASCADDQNLKIVRCSTFQGRWYPDFWRVEKNPFSRHFSSRGIYYVFRSSDSISEGPFFTVWAKVPNKVERERESRIRTEQKSTMGMRPLDESAPSARKG